MDKKFKDFVCKKKTKKRVRTQKKRVKKEEKRKHKKYNRQGRPQ